jgi:hypothetical protein
LGSYVGSYPTPLSCQKIVSLSQSSGVSPVELTDRGGGGRGAKHTIKREPGHLEIILYSLVCAPYLARPPCALQNKAHYCRITFSNRRLCSSNTQSRQSAKRFSSRWNWDSPTPLAAGECAPPPYGPGGRAHSLAAKGVGESQFQRGDIHCGALYI